MSHKLKHSLAAILAIVLVVSLLPLRSFVRADSEQGIYYIYEYYDEQADEFIYSVDQYLSDNAERLGVFINGGSYEYQEGDGLVIANNATVYVSSDIILSDDLNYYLAGNAVISTEFFDVYSDVEEYDGEISFDALEEYCLNYSADKTLEFTSDYRFDGQQYYYLDSFENVIVPEDVTVTLGTAKRHGKPSGVDLYVKNLLVDGTLVIEGVSEGIISLNELDIVENGSLVIGDDGELTGGHGACIYPFSDVTFTNFTTYEYDYVEQTLEEVPSDEIDRVIFDEEIGYWITSDVLTFSNWFSASYKDFGRGSLLTANDQKVYDYGYYPYEAGSEISFALTIPPERLGETPEVSIIYNNDLGCAIPELTKISESEYNFSFTPEYSTGFSVNIIWSDFDVTSYDDESFYVELQCYGSLSFEFSPEGEVFEEPNNPKHVRVRYGNAAITDGITVTVSPESGHSICNVRYDWQYYDLFEIPDVDALELEDGILVWNLNADNYDQGTNRLEVTADDANSYESDIPDEYEFFLDADIWETNGIPQASIHISTDEFENLYVNDYWSQYEFDVGEEITFDLIPPAVRQIEGLKPIVNITQGDNSWSSLDAGIELTESDDFEFSFTFVPEISDGFIVEIYWSEFDRISGDPGDLLLDISTSRDANGYNFIDQPESFMTEPGNLSHRKCLYLADYLPEDGIAIEIDPGEDVLVNEVEIEYGSSKQTYVRNDIVLSEEDDNLYFSDLDWFSEDDNGTTILTIPTDCNISYIRVNILYDGDFGDEPEIGQYKLEYSQSWDADWNPLTYIQVDGGLVNDGCLYDFTAGEELVFTIHAPDDRAGLERYILIYYDDGDCYSSHAEDPDKLITVTNDQFSFKPADGRSFTVRIDWCEFDSLRSSKEQMLINSVAYGGGSISVNDADYTVFDPADDRQRRDLVSTSGINDENPVYVYFYPLGDAKLEDIYVSVDGSDQIHYVTEECTWDPDAILITDDSHFEFFGGVWGYKITKITKDKCDYQFQANFFTPEEPETGNITVISGDVGVQYAFVKDGVQGSFADVGEKIILDPEDIADQVILKFTPEDGETLPSLRIQRTIMGAIMNPRIIQADDNNTIVLDKGDYLWGTWTVEFADGSEISPYEFMICVIGSDGYDPLVNYKSGVVYGYEEAAVIDLDLGDAMPYMVLACPNDGDEVELYKGSDGMYSYMPEYLTGFTIFVYEDPDAHDFYVYTAGEGEMQFEFNLYFNGYPEGQIPSSRVSMLSRIINSVFSSDGSRIRAIVSDDTESFSWKITKGDEALNFVVMLNGQDITGQVSSDGVLTLNRTVLEDDMDLSITFNYCKTFAITSEYTEGGSVSVPSESKEGKTVKITATPFEGYVIDCIKVNGEVITGDEFTMPSENVKVEVVFRRLEYTVTLNEVTGGTASVSATSAKPGDEILITYEPAEGYEFVEIKVDGEKLDGNKFTMPAKDVVVDIVFEKKAEEVKNGWVFEDGKYYYYDNGTMKTGWISGGNAWYYMDPDTGIMVTGWKQIGGKWYYFTPSGAMVTGWSSSGSKWYYFEPSGAMASGWKEIGGKWYLFGSSGDMLTRWQISGGKWYYFTDSGAMVTGWNTIGGKWYFFEPSGAMVTGWKSIGGKWYYFESSGAMVSGWKQIGNTWYYFSGGGEMATGWKSIGGTWYYFSDGGEMATGWKQLGGKWYYFYGSGAMAYNTTIDGCKLDASGVWVT